jgi:hypothetical protein
MISSRHVSSGRMGRLAALGLALMVACTERTDAVQKAEPTATVAKQGPGESETPQPLGAEQLLAAAVEAMGGAAKFDALESFYSEATLNTGALGLTGTAKTWWRGGDFYNESEMPGVGQMKIGRLADKVWGNDPISGLRALSDKEAEQAMWSASLCLAHDWRRYFKTVSGPKAAVEDGKKVLELSLTTPLGDVVMLRLDAETKLPVSQSFTQVSPLGSMPMTVRFKDYREVDGLKIPFQQELDASLTKVTSTTVKIEFNAPVDEAKFAMPGAAQAVVPGMLVDSAKVDPTKTPPEPDKKSASANKPKPKPM